LNRPRLLQELKDRHRDVMRELLMDMLRALSAPNLDIRKKALDIALDLIDARNIDEVVGVLKKEAMKTQSRELEKGAEYRQLLVQAIHACAVRFPDVAASVLHLLCDFLSDTNTASALDVIFFIREIIEVGGRGGRQAAWPLLACSAAGGIGMRRVRWLHTPQRVQPAPSRPASSPLPPPRRPTPSCTTPSLSG
jgi:vesicle coat complex subunit